MRVCLFDDARGGHHGAFMRGVASGFCALDGDVTAYFPELLDGVDGSIRTEVVPRALLTTYSRTQRNIARAARDAARSGAMVFGDLFFDKNVLSIAPDLSRIPRRFRVLHRPRRFASEGQTRKGAVRAVASRALARRRLTRGDVIVVHTSQALDAATHSLPGARIHQLGLPGVSEGALRDRAARPQPHPAAPPRILFVGADRREKGLDVLVAALDGLDAGAELEIVGKQPDGTRERFSADAFPNVRFRWLDGAVTDEQIVAAYERATVVAMPYRPEFAEHGGASLTLIEALSFGLPVVATPALREQLPSGCGAIIAEDDTVPAFGAALERVLRDPVGADRAARGAIDFVMAHHTYESYARAVLDATAG